MSEKNIKKFGKDNYNKFYNNRNNYKKNNKRKQFYKNNYNNQFKNNNKKTVEEYEKIYLDKRMNDESEKPICPICNNPIYITEEGINHNETNRLAHFECILNEIRQKNISEIEENDKIVYLGSGTFGIVRERQNGKKFNLFVRKRINYENRKVKKIDNDADPEEEELFNV